MISFLRTRRKTWIPLLCVVLLLTGCFITYLFLTITHPYQWMPDGIRFSLEGSTVSFREPYHGEYSYTNMGTYSHDYFGRKNTSYAKLLIRKVRLISFERMTSFNEPTTDEYLLIDAVIQKVFYDSSPNTLSSGQSVMLYSNYIPDESTLACMIPKIESGRTYYMGLTVMSSPVNPPTQSYITMDKLADYYVAPEIYNCMPVTDQGTVILSEAMKLDPNSPFTAGLSERNSFYVNQTTSVADFEELYMSLIRFNFPESVPASDS